jgi:hypothetical protein
MIMDIKALEFIVLSEGGMLLRKYDDLSSGFTIIHDLHPEFKALYMDGLKRDVRLHKMKRDSSPCFVIDTFQDMQDLPLEVEHEKNRH